ncbi:MAG: hypothetical protein JWR81_4054 [Pseudonocardia sp.]|jgi:hypothetical protein|nr:hypothetical protein [Pseudonocardia sp.]MDT7613871.1 hypothetical protein [Pseudonocardiales bacterium]
MGRPGRRRPRPLPPITGGWLPTSAAGGPLPGGGAIMDGGLLTSGGPLSRGRAIAGGGLPTTGGPAIPGGWRSPPALVDASGHTASLPLFTGRRRPAEIVGAPFARDQRGGHDHPPRVGVGVRAGRVRVRPATVTGRLNPGPLRRPAPGPWRPA